MQRGLCPDGRDGTGGRGEGVTPPLSSTDAANSGGAADGAAGDAVVGRGSAEVKDGVASEEEAIAEVGSVATTGSTTTATTATPSAASLATAPAASAERRPRTIFISLSALLRADWPALRADQRLATALFFFGSKRSWVFPRTLAERKESSRQPTNYTRAAGEELRQLILAKERAGQVCWLKPDGFQYDGRLDSGDPKAFARVSKWLAGIRDPMATAGMEGGGGGGGGAGDGRGGGGARGGMYRPLLLDPKWWRRDGGFGKSPTRGKYCSQGGTVVQLFLSGSHDYYPLMELLHQSNPTLDVVLNPR